MMFSKWEARGKTEIIFLASPYVIHIAVNVPVRII